MPLVDESYDSLPYIDTAPTDNQLSSARTLVDAEIRSAGIDTSQIHPALIPSAYDPRFSSAIEEQHALLSAEPSHKLSAIDLSRYQALEPPSIKPTTEDEKAEWIDTLKKTYINSQYLTWRTTALSQLEQHGKNAWLIGNSQVEDVLRPIEADLADAKSQMEGLEGERRTVQEGKGAEMRILEETWKKGVGRVLETEVAVEGLRREILEKRRAGAV